MKITINGASPLTVEEVRETGWDGVYHIILEDCSEYYVAESSEVAGQATREYWKDMAENDPREFTCLVGEETLIQWGMGHFAGPGSTKVNSLEEWLDLTADYPEEHFASYDGEERSFEIISYNVDESDIDFNVLPEIGVAYRHN